MRTRKAIISGCLLLILVLIGETALSESLWDEHADGFFSGKGSLQIGDIIRVRVTSESKFSVKASRIDNKQISLDITGGDTAGLFTFLPAADTGNTANFKGEEDYSLETEIALRVQGFDEYGMALLSGKKETILQGKKEILILEGYVNPAVISASKTVPFEALANVSLSYTTFIETGDSIITNDELIEKYLTIDLNSTDENGTIITKEEFEGYRLSDPKKKELLLVYLNKFIELVFK